MVQSDFVNIELSKEGAAMAGANGALRITTLHFSYLFQPGASERVLTSEWARVLSLEKHQGTPIFQVVADAAQPDKAKLIAQPDEAKQKGAK
jgi:hypothetical protein